MAEIAISGGQNFFFFLHNFPRKILAWVSNFKNLTIPSKKLRTRLSVGRILESYDIIRLWNDLKFGTVGYSIIKFSLYFNFINGAHITILI